MKIFFKGFPFLFAFLLLASCSKEEMDQQNECDLHQYTGNWRFILNGDPATEFIGQIDKFDNETLNITYQPNTANEYFFQTEVNCENGLIFKRIPAGNHGTTTIEGSITLDSFIYQDSTYINYTGQPVIRIKVIEGTKI